MAAIRDAWWIGLVAFGIALALLVPGLGDYGFWNGAELPIMDRTRAAMGEAVVGLQRSPWLPDLLRTWSVGLLGEEFGLRLPHALSVAALAGIAGGWARQRGASRLVSITASLIAVSFPLSTVAGRTALGNPMGELLVVLAIAAGLAAVRCTSWPRALALILATAAALACSVAASGLLLGACLPLAILASADLGKRAHIVTPLLWGAALATLVATVWLVLGQQDGYIPILGAAKDLHLVEKPQGRRFAAVLADFGYSVFPWAGLLLVGALHKLGRWPALWTVLTLAGVGGWSLIYGPTAAPILVPGALCAAVALTTMLDSARVPWERRMSLFLIAAAGLVLRQDAKLHPSRLVTPAYHFEGEHHFPADELRASQRLGAPAKYALLAVVMAGLLGRRRERGVLERAASLVPDKARDVLVVGAFAGAAVACNFTIGRGLLPDTARRLSVREPLQRFAQWVERDQLPPDLLVHRVRDPGVALYGPTQLDSAQNRRELTTKLSGDAPAVALIRSGDLPTTYQHARQRGWPLFVLDDTNARYRLVSNVLPEGAEDLLPFKTIVFDEPVQLANETLVRFEEYVEVTSWQVDGPLRRGRTHTLEVALTVLRPLPAGSKIYTRFIKGRLSRINGDPQELTDKAYPCNLWRKGDYIVHRQEFEVPPLEILPGTYKLNLGLRRSEKKNFKISAPEGKTGDFGVVITDRAHEFAEIGFVEVW